MYCLKNLTVLDIGKREYKRCTKCIMDTTAPTIEFDEKGICNYCKEQKVINLSKRDSMQTVLNDILRRTEKFGSDYNGVMGINGGINSCYLAYLMHRHDLNILLIHIDDGWDTEAAKHNVSVIVDKTGWEYKYIKLNPEEYHDIIRAYLDAGVLSLEMISDNLVRKQVYKIAEEYHIKNIFSGNNLSSEGILPRGGGHDNNDRRNIKDIHSKHGTIELIDLEFLSGTSRILKQILYRYKEYKPLNHLEIPYNRLKAQDTLEDVWVGEDMVRNTMRIDIRDSLKHIYFQLGLGLIKGLHIILH